MAKYICRVFIVVEADSKNDAADAVSGAMTYTLEASGAIYEWAYSSGEDGIYDHPRLVKGELQSSRYDFDHIWNNQT